MLVDAIIKLNSYMVDGKVDETLAVFTYQWILIMVLAHKLKMEDVSLAEGGGLEVKFSANGEVGYGYVLPSEEVTVKTHNDNGTKKYEHTQDISDQLERLRKELYSE